MQKCRSVEVKKCVVRPILKQVASELTECFCCCEYSIYVVIFVVFDGGGDHLVVISDLLFLMTTATYPEYG